MPSEPGLKAWVRIDRSDMAAPIARVGIAAMATMNGHRLSDAGGRDREAGLDHADRADDVTGEARGEAEALPDRDLAAVDLPELGDQALVGEHAHESGDGGGVGDGPVS